MSIRNIAFGTTMTTQMMIPKAFVVGNMMYYLADELKVYSPKFFVGTSKTIRVIIERKKIPEYDYIYAIKNGVEWNILDETSKKAKLLIGKDWVDTNFKLIEPTVNVKPKIIKEKKTVPVVVPVVVDVVENNDNDIIETDIIDDIMEEAPPIFELNEEEKFKDVYGNVLEIETRGERHEDKIYFKVKDVSVAFGMPNLLSSLLKKYRGYERNVDYKTFNLKGFTNGKITNKQRMYLTYNGFLKVINVSRNQSLFSNTNINIVYKWLANLLNYKININNSLVCVNINTSGLLYIVSSPLIGVVKIGYWTGDENGLYSRYRMVYGQDVILHNKYVANVREVEKEIHNYFEEYNISGELFEKDKLELYIEYLNNELVEIERVVDVITENVVVNSEVVVNSDDDDIIETDIIEEGIEEAPPIFELNEEEKFKDVDGNVIEIETRGERHLNKIYFKVKNVADSFGMKNLTSILLHKDKGYEKNVDYKLFNLKGMTQVGKKTTNKKRLYLTYEGMLRMLFVSRNANANVFRKWATTIIYTHQLGTVEQKEVLGADLLKIPLKQFKEAFKAYTGKFPCIYLFELGTVRCLRALYSISPDISDDDIVYKYGFTDDIVRRFTEHTKDYGKLKDVNVYLSQFTLIDTKFMSEAENELRQFFNDFDKALHVEGKRELITLNQKELKQVRKQFEILRNDYSGSTQGLQTIIEDLKNKIVNGNIEFNNQLHIKELEHKNEIFKKEMEYKINNEIQIGIINCKDKEIKCKEMEIKCKEMEIQFQNERLINKDLQLQIEISKNT